jgi:hypothetical protein
MGSGVMGPYGYAPADGTISWMCALSSSVDWFVAINTTYGNIVVGHVAAGASLTTGQDVSSGQRLGGLAYGDIEDNAANCGWAIQCDSCYHIHFAFQDSPYQLENCIIDASTDAITCNGTIYTPGTNLPVSTGGGGDPDSESGARIWDQFIYAIKMAADALEEMLPEVPPEVTYLADRVNSYIVVLMQMVNLLLMLMFNAGFTFTILFVIIVGVVAMETTYLAFAIFMWLKHAMVAILKPI